MVPQVGVYRDFEFFFIENRVESMCQYVSSKLEEYIDQMEVVKVRFIFCKYTLEITALRHDICQCDLRIVPGIVCFHWLV